MGVSRIVNDQETAADLILYADEIEYFDTHDLGEELEVRALPALGDADGLCHALSISAPRRALHAQLGRQVGADGPAGSGIGPASAVHRL